MKTSVLNIRDFPEKLQYKLKIEAAEKRLSLRAYVIAILEQRPNGLNKQRAK